LAHRLLCLVVEHLIVDLCTTSVFICEVSTYVTVHRLVDNRSVDMLLKDCGAVKQTYWPASGLNFVESVHHRLSAAVRAP